MLTWWSLVGCYTFVPVVSAHPETISDNVRVTLTSAGTTAMQPLLGNNVRALEGVIRSSTADSLTISLEQTITDTQGVLVSSGMTVAVARPMVASVAVRQISRRKSTFLVVAVIGVVLAALAGTGFAGSSSDGGTTPSPIQP